MANARRKHYHLEYRNFGGSYRDVTDKNGNVKMFVGIQNARKGAAKFIKEHYGIMTVAVFGGRMVNPVAGVISKTKFGLEWIDYYHDNKRYHLNDDGTTDKWIEWK